MLEYESNTDLSASRDIYRIFKDRFPDEVIGNMLDVYARSEDLVLPKPKDLIEILSESVEFTPDSFIRGLMHPYPMDNGHWNTIIVGENRRSISLIARPKELKKLLEQVISEFYNHNSEGIQFKEQLAALSFKYEGVQEDKGNNWKRASLFQKTLFPKRIPQN